MLTFLREHYDSNVTLTKEASLTDNDDSNNSIGVYRYSKIGVYRYSKIGVYRYSKTANGQ